MIATTQRGFKECKAGLYSDGSADAVPQEYKLMLNTDFWNLQRSRQMAFT